MAGLLGGIGFGDRLVPAAAPVAASHAAVQETASASAGASLEAPVSGHPRSAASGSEIAASATTTPVDSAPASDSSADAAGTIADADLASLYGTVYGGLDDDDSGADGGTGLAEGYAAALSAAFGDAASGGEGEGT